MARIKTRTLAAIAASANGLVTAVAPTDGVPLTLLMNQLPTPRRLSFDATGDMSSVVFTIVGRDRSGVPITETVTGVTTTNVETRYIYDYVTSITPSPGSAQSVTVGWLNEAYAAPVMLNSIKESFTVGFQVEVTGTVNFDIQHTLYDLQNAGNPMSPQPEGTGEWQNHETIFNKTGDEDGNYAFPIEAMRIRLNSGTGSVVLKVIQSGM